MFVNYYIHSDIFIHNRISFFPLSDHFFIDPSSDQDMSGKRAFPPLKAATTRRSVSNVQTFENPTAVQFLENCVQLGNLLKKGSSKFQVSSWPMRYLNLLKIVVLDTSCDLWPLNCDLDGWHESILDWWRCSHKPICQILSTLSVKNWPIGTLSKSKMAKFGTGFCYTSSIVKLNNVKNRYFFLVIEL